MKRVLITGAGSYVGTHVMQRLQEEPDKFEVQELSVKGDSWKTFDFSKFDAVYHVAGIAHMPADASIERLHFQINRDLTKEVAIQAKRAGVKQFIFMGSMSIYGNSLPAGKGAPINFDTPAQPTSAYGESKLEAEEFLESLEDEDFKVAIVRAPMVFGAHAKGNFTKLVQLMKKLPVFPDVQNKRSMLYIGNLAELIAQIILYESRGVYLPQEETYVCTSELVTSLAELYGKRVHLTKAFNPFLLGPLRNKEVVVKAFGDMYYELSASEFDFNYRRYSIKEALEQIAEEESWQV